VAERTPQAVSEPASAPRRLGPAWGSLRMGSCGEVAPGLRERCVVGARDRRSQARAGPFSACARVPIDLLRFDSLPIRYLRGTASFRISGSLYENIRT